MPASAGQRQEAPASKSEYTILIAEDAEMLGELMLAKLHRAGYRALLRKDGNAAWAAIREENPDLIILDWTMPGNDGIHLLALIRDNPVTEQTPVMMVTAMAEKAEVMTAIQIGANDYIVKPFRTEDLIARVRRLLKHPPKA